ncbi:MAG: hypothetical protein Q9183_001839 [Haloplaca sp. 2 TL-2023]
MLRSITCAASIWALTLGLASAKVQYGGVNIAGFDFGCVISGSCDTSDVVPPLREYKGQDGAAQMQHFVTNNRLNAFRLPVGWQYLVDEPGSPLIPEHIEAFDALVQACLATESLCIIDIHNYARWDGLIVGQGGPTDEQFASLWSQLATKYARSPNVAMGIVNEPHDMPSITRWAQTCQTVVNAIREAGAAENMILLPGNGYTNAADFVSSGSAAALARVKDVDGTTDKLMFEVHKYLDEDNSGTHIECVSSYVDTFEDLTQWLKDNGRRALLAEVGGGPYQKSCLRDVCELLTYLNDNGDVYAGYLGWGAGSFDETYELSLSPNGTEDVPLMTECFAKVFDGGSGEAPVSGNASTSDQSFSNSTLPEPAAESSGSGGNEAEYRHQRTLLGKTLAQATLVRAMLAQKLLAQELLAQKTLVQKILVQETLIREALAQGIRAQKTLAQETMAWETLAQGTLAQATLVQAMLAQAVLAQAMLAQEMPAQLILAQRFLAQKLLAQGLLAQEVLAQTPSALETQAQETLAREMLAQKLPAREI